MFTKLCLLTLSVLAGGVAQAQAPAQFVVGYYQNSSAFPLSNLAANGSLTHLTHLNYAFARIVDTVRPGGNAQNQADHVYTCAPNEPEAETGTNGVFRQLLALKNTNPNLKILISVGGALGSGYFSSAADDAHRAGFTQSCIDQFVDGQFTSPKVAGVFDGIDLDWEFPLNATDQSNYNLLLREFRTRLDTYKQGHPAIQRLLLTSAVSPSNGPDTGLQNILFSGPTGASSYVDFFNVMTYDYAGTWNETTSSTAPLGAIRHQIDDLMTRYGVPANKMVLGIPFYGVHYSGNLAGLTPGTALATLLAQASKTPVLTPGDPYQSTQTIDYSSLVSNTLMVSNGSANPNVGISHDVDSSAWAFDAANALLWSYDDETTIAAKAAYARTTGMAGIMTWDISKDTVSGTLLCAMETGASGGTTPVCGSAPVSNPGGNQTGTMLYDFEGVREDVQGWVRTGGVFSIDNSTDQANTGIQSLAAHFITYRQAYQPHGTVYVTPPSLVQPGSTVTFRVWVPQSAFTNLSGIIPFFMDANWTWTSTAVDMSKLTPNAWNTMSIQVPANAVLPFTEMGIQFDSKNTWNGIVYIDTVSVR